MPSRCIHLRRPAVLHVQEGLFVPQGNVLHEVDRRWEALCESNPAYFDGRAYNVLGVSRTGCGGAVIHIIECAYRFYAVQTEDFDLGVMGLGVKGFTIRGDRALMGRRSQSVGVYPNQWEFAPGGVAEPGKEPVDILAGELHQETRLSASIDPAPIAVLCDPVARTWELIYLFNDPQGEAQTTPEYSQLRWCMRDELPDDLSPIAQSMIPLWPTSQG
ncbi:MAG: NUDIX domain-containing protein [Phycisphaerales bacterium]